MFQKEQITNMNRKIEGSDSFQTGLDMSITVMARFLTASSSSLSTSRIVTCRDGIDPLKLLATRISHSMEAFLVRSNRVLNGPHSRLLSRSLAPLTPQTCSAALR